MATFQTCTFQTCTRRRLYLCAAALKTLRELLENKAALAALERPRFPNPGWQLPAETGSAKERQLMEDLAVIEADYKAARMTDAIVTAQDRTAGAAPES